MTKRWDVLGFGAVAVDDLLYLDDYPLPDTKVPIQSQRREGGGLAGTALVAAARLGARAAYCGVLGDDELSRFSIEELEREGVDCTPVVLQAQARPIHSVVIVSQATGERTLLYSHAGVMQPQPQDISDELIGACRVLFVDHTVLQAALCATDVAQRFGIPVVADIESDQDPHLSALLPRVDHLIVGIDFAQNMTGERSPAAMVRALSGKDRACCVVTVGKRGCWYAERGGDVRHFPAFDVQVVDTNGCGDVFHGAYAACLAQGERVDTAVEIATAAAGIKATHPGGRSGIPTRSMIDQFLVEHLHAA